MRNPVAILYTTGSLPVLTDYSGRLVFTGSVAIDANSPTSPLWVTGSVVTNFPITQSVYVANPITGAVSVNSLTFVSGNNLSVFVSASNTQTVTGTVGITNFPTIQTVTGSIGFSGIPTITGSVGITNLPVTQSITGSVGLSGIPTITGSVSVLNTVTVTGSVTSFSTLGFAGTGSISPTTGSLVGGKDATGNFQPLAVTTSGVQVVTGTITVPNILNVTGSVGITNFPVTQSITGSVGLAGIPTITGSITVSNLVSTTGSVAVTNVPTVTGSVSVLNAVTVVNTTTAGTGSVSPITGSLVGGKDVVGNYQAFRVDTIGNLFVSAAVTGAVAFSGIPTITGSVGVTNFPITQSVFVGNASLPVSVSNFPLTQPVTGTVGIVGNGSATPFWITGSITSFSTLGFAGTGSVSPITGSLVGGKDTAGNFQAFRVDTIGNQFVSATITGTVAFSGIPTITGNIGVTNFPITQSVFVSNPITGSVSVNNLTFVSGTNLSVFVSGANTQNVTGTVGIVGNSSTIPLWVTGNLSVAPSTLGFAGTGSLSPITGSLVGGKDTVGNFQAFRVDTIGNLFVSATITGTVAFSGIPTITGSVGVTNFPTTQSVFISNAITGAVSVNSLTFVSGNNLSVFVSGANTQVVTGNVGIVGNSSTIPLWVTGNLAVSPSTLGFAGTGSLSPITGSLVGGKDTSGNYQAFRVDTIGNLFVSATVTGTVAFSGIPTITGSVGITNFPLTQSVFVSNPITGAVSVNSLTFVSGNNLSVFISASNTQTVTGNVGIVGNSSAIPLWVTGNLAVSPSTLGFAGTGSVSPITGSLVGGKDTAGNFQAIRVDTIGNQFVSAAISGTVAFSGIPTITGTVGITNFPLTQSVFVSNAITGAVSVNSLTFVSGNNLSVFVSGANTQNITGTVGIVGNSSTIPLWVTGNLAVAPSTLGFAGTGSVAPITGSLVGGKDTAGNYQAFRVDTIGNLFVSAAITGTVAFSGIPTITGNVGITNFPLTQSVFVANPITGSVTVNGLTFVSGSSLSVFVSGTNVQPITGTVGIVGNSSTIPLWVTGNLAVSPSTLGFAGTGSISPITGSLVGGSDGTNFRALSVDSTGKLNVNTTSVNASVAGTASIAPSSASLVAGVDNTGLLRPFSVGATGILNANSTISTQGQTSFDPDPTNFTDTAGVDVLYSDVTGHLMTRGAVYTDENSFRDNFTNFLTQSLTGNCTFTNGSLFVQGSGTKFLTELNKYHYIRITSDANTTFAVVSDVFSDVSLSLGKVYAGTSTTAAAVKSLWEIQVATGGAVGITGSKLVLDPGTSSPQTSSVYRTADYAPMCISAFLDINQRLSTQTAWFGFRDLPFNYTNQAAFVFDGTGSNTVKCVTDVSTNPLDSQVTTVALPFGLSTTQSLEYTIGFAATNVAFSISGTVVATHRISVPSPYIDMSMSIGVANNAASVAGTLLSVNTIVNSNVDRVDVMSSFPGDPQSVRVTGRDPNGNQLLVPVNTTGSLATFNYDRDGATLVTNTDRDGRLRTETEFPMFHDDFDGNVINLNQWNPSRPSAMSMTQSNRTGLTLNGTFSVTSGGYASLSSVRYFPVGMQYYTSLKARVNFSASAQGIEEFGYGVGAGSITPTGQTLANGIFFRVSGTFASTASIMGVQNNNGTESSVSLGYVQTGSYYDVEIFKQAQVAQFRVVDMSGSLVSNGFLQAPSYLTNHVTMSHLPIMARTYNSGAGVSASIMRLASVDLSLGGLNLTRTYNDFMAGNSRTAISPPNSASSIANVSNSLNIGLGSLSNTAATYTTLGGKFKFLTVAGAATDYALFGYQVPQIPGYSLVVNSVTIQAVNLGTVVTTNPTVLEWQLGVNSTAASLNTLPPGGPIRTAIGVQSLQVAISSSGIGAMFNPNVVNYAPKNPLVVHPGRFFHVILTVPTGSATAGNIITGFVNVDGYWE